MANFYGLVGGSLSGISLLFSIIAVSLNYWQTTDALNSDINAGLWKVCTTVAGTTVCLDINKDTVTSDDLDNYRAVRAMVILGILLMAAAIVTTVVVMFVMPSMKMLFFAAAGLALAAGFFFMVGMAVYADKLTTSNSNLHAAFALDIIAWLVAWAAAGVFVGAKVLDKEI